MNRNNIRRVGFIALSLPLAFAITSCHQTPTSNPPPPGRLPVVKGDSPAEVVGGSLFLKWKTGFKPDDFCKEAPNKICGHSDGAISLELQNLGTLPVTAVLANGWKFKVRDPQKAEVLTICSAPDCSFSSWDGNNYYVKVRDKEQAIDYPAINEKHFHDDVDCPTGGMDNRKCDRAVRFEFTFATATSGVTVDYNTTPGTLPCDSSTDPKDRCIVFIGTRPIN